MSILIEISKSSNKLKEILNSLKQRDKFSYNTLRIIYNAKYKYKINEYGGRS